MIWSKIGDGLMFNAGFWLGAWTFGPWHPAAYLAISCIIGVVACEMLARVETRS